ncbi:DMT family transporter [Sulfitobacter sp.]|uniref:DMT family transporter n=1 Tax=Sulfitobacter sp. TaxID=1903071 RepID=UPI00356A7AAF
MAATMTEHRPGRAIALKLGAVFLFTVMAAVIKIATETVPAGQAVFFRSFFAFPMIILWLWQRGDLRHGLKPSNLMGHVWRGIFGTTAMGLTFGGLSLLPLPEVTAIGYATPLFTVIFAVLFLGERVRLFRLSAVAVGLIGVLIVLYPRFTIGGDAVSQMATLGALMVLGASIMRALVQVHVRRLVQTDSTAAIVFFFSLTATVLSFLTLPLGMLVDWPALTWVMPGLQVSLLLICSGLIGGVAQIMITSSFRFGPVSMLAPFDYASMIFATLIGWLVFSEIPTPAILIGAGLVMTGGVLIIWRERQLGLDRSKSKASSPPQGTPS